MKKKIIFTSGGTGGHIFPAVHLMKHFIEKGYEVILITDVRGSGFLKSSAEFRTYILKIETPTKKNLFKKILSFFSIFNSIIQSIIILRKEKPSLIFGLGGYVSFPASLASRILNLPLVTYENNAVLGRANRYLLPIVKKIFIAREIEINFPSKYKKKTYKIGPILDKRINDYYKFEKKEDGVFSILILGGSQGAEIFGRVVPEVMKMIKKQGHNIKIIQQCVKDQKSQIKYFYEKNEIEHYVFDFDTNILKLISLSDLAITRCGASATAELSHALTPFIAVPLPQSIDNHQYLNAKYYENKGCCWILEQKNFNTKNLFNLIMDTILNKNKLKKIRENMKKNYSNDVYSNIEKEIKEFF